MSDSCPSCWRGIGESALSFPATCRRPRATAKPCLSRSEPHRPKAGDADLSYVESVAREISGGVDQYKVVVEKSTVPVYTSQWIRTIIMRNGADPSLFDVASNPEFLREGTAVTDFLYPDRIVVGVESERAAEVMRQIYEPLTSGWYYGRVDAIPRPEAAQVPPRSDRHQHEERGTDQARFQRLSGDEDFFHQCGGVDLRIGGRECPAGVRRDWDGFEDWAAISESRHRVWRVVLSEDLMAFRAVAKESGYDFRLLEEVIRINEDQRHRFLRKVRSVLWTFRGKRLGVLGLAFKGGTDDIRESPAMLLVQELLREGCRVCAYDPAAMERAKEVLKSGVEFASDAYEAATGADAVLILTEWEEFAALDLERLRQLVKYPIVLDGRNLYDPAVMVEHGFSYYSVGRPAALTEELTAAALPKKKERA